MNIKKLIIKIFGYSKSKVYTPRELREMGCTHYEDTVIEFWHKSLWIDKKGNIYKCTHSSKAKTDFLGRDVYDRNIATNSLWKMPR